MDQQIDPPLTVAFLVRAAQGYLSRRAASRLQLERVLLRKARRHAAGQDEIEPASLQALVEAAVERVVQAGWIDDSSLAQSRAASLARNGLPVRTMRRRLTQQGLAFDPSGLGDGELDDATQARRFAERKRLGPFASGRRAPSPERDLRAMLRAGFSLEIATRVMNDLAESFAGNGGERSAGDMNNL